MFKILKKWSKAIFFGAASLLVFFCLFFAALQTKWAKTKANEWLISAAAQKGIVITLDSLEGMPPFKWTIRNLYIELNATDTLTIKNVHLRLSLIPLLNKQFSFSFFKADEVIYAFAEKEGKEGFSITEEELKEAICFFSLPFSLSISNFIATPIYAENLTRKMSGSFFLQGNGNISKNANVFHINCKIGSLDYAKAQLDVFLDGALPRNKIESRISMRLSTIQALMPFTFLPFETNISLHTRLQGSWNSWKTLIGFQENQNTEPLTGQIKAHCSLLDIPDKYELNRKWSLKSNFSLFTDHSIKVEQLILQSDLIKLLAKGSLSPEFFPSSLYGSLEIYDLSPLSSLISFPIRGSLDSQIKYDGQSALLSFSTSHLKLGALPFDALQGSLEAMNEAGKWEGKGHIHASPTSLPLDASLDFLFDPSGQFAVKDISIKAPEAEINGALSWQFKPSRLNGDLIAYVQDINQFQKIFPLSPLSGSLGAEIHLISDVTQDALVYAKAKNFHYLGLSANQMSVTARVSDLFGVPQGKIDLEGEDISYRQLSLSYLDINTASNKENWAYSLSADGVWKEPLEVQSTGSWAKDNQNFQVTLDSFSGIMLGKPFSLEAPFTIKSGLDHFQIEHCAFKLEEGHFLATMDFKPGYSKVEVLAERFPIDLLTLTHPYFSLHGTSSVDIFLEGSQDHLEGRANLILEEASLASLGKKNPLEAKGSLQINFSQNIMQLHSSLYASGEQYLEYTATLPTQYTSFPFSVEIEKTRPLSGEITVEGNLEEIFDFVNIGSHGVTGNLSGRLFLSKNWASPSLVGEVTLANGTYENYYTGTYLTDITANIKAENTELRLIRMEAKDDQGGHFAAAGALHLDPENKFPYSVDAHLEDLHSVKFDWITGNLSGPLSITGNSTYALGKGALTVSKADIDIPDENLLSNVSVLPVTYVNMPITSGYTLPSSPVFPVKLDLDLTAPGRVIVRGKGLDSEWQGNVHLTGTNTTFLANGTLTLVKGEFIFSGKAFSLTNGEITFSDKPTQSAYINLSGSLNIADISIHVLLKGPLSAPALTFQSSPHLPTSSILSYILFNKDISEISPMQAIQLAQVVVSLSGGKGPNILETIRKRLGVDRLNIVSTGSADEITVQIGKYITRGVMVTLSQSQTSSNIIVEVDLKKGFIFQAETQEEEEGKFSLKWNKNY